MKFSKMMYNLDEEQIERAIGNKEFCYWQDKKTDNTVFSFLTLGTAKFKQLD